MSCPEITLHAALQSVALVCNVPHFLCPHKNEPPSSVTAFLLLNFIVLALLFPRISKNPSASSVKRRTSTTRRHRCPHTRKSQRELGGPDEAPRGHAKRRRDDLPLRRRKSAEGHRIASIADGFSEGKQLHSSKDIVASLNLYPNGSVATTCSATTHPEQVLALYVEGPKGENQQAPSEGMANSLSTLDMDKRFDEFISSFFARVRAEIRGSRN
ncbi:hypothetical protein KP509_29G010900 [Ceratopteris richardii]|uniref:Uncharacterized protein n=1 Tax=Ceratopteris richardii TaxID=49495 RepID=A0A8T2R4Q1_CERRI|nr:hypothetical protein KP509_29G010900 [Ceratopteris richardii]